MSDHGSDCPARLSTAAFRYRELMAKEATISKGHGVSEQSGVEFKSDVSDNEGRRLRGAKNAVQLTKETLKQHSASAVAGLRKQAQNRHYIPPAPAMRKGMRRARRLLLGCLVAGTTTALPVYMLHEEAFLGSKQNAADMELDTQSHEYPSTMVGCRSPAEYGMSFDSVKFKNRSGKTLRGFLLKQENPKKCPTAIFLGGRAHSAGTCLPWLHRVMKLSDVNILCMDYQGFGGSEGDASEFGMYSDAEDMLQYLHTGPGSTIIDPERITVWGHSLGCAVASRLGATVDDQKLKGVILQAPFTQASDATARVVPEWVPRWLISVVLKGKFPTQEYVGQITGKPCMFVTGTLDPICGVDMANALFRACPTTKKQLVKVNGAQHRFGSYTIFPKTFAKVGQFIRFATRTARHQTSDQKDDDKIPKHTKTSSVATDSTPFVGLDSSAAAGDGEHSLSVPQAYKAEVQPDYTAWNDVLPQYYEIGGSGITRRLQTLFL